MKRRLYLTLLLFLAAFVSGCRGATVEPSELLATIADVKLETKDKNVVIAIAPKMALPREQYIVYRCSKNDELQGYGAATVSELIAKSKSDERILFETLCQAEEVDQVMVALMDRVPLVWE